MQATYGHYFPVNLHLHFSFQVPHDVAVSALDWNLTFRQFHLLCFSDRTGEVLPYVEAFNNINLFPKTSKARSVFITDYITCDLAQLPMFTSKIIDT